jgi:DNA processing protein
VSHLVHPQPGYPDRLIGLRFTPELYVQGTLGASTTRSVAIVGARAATTRGMDRAHAIARHCATRGIHVVSGGALGIDGAAHRGALAGDGATTVVLGSGIDVLYPARHAPMFRAIVAAGGALVSMLPPGTTPRSHTFLTRNKLIAALADVTIVVEATLASGSLSTAAHADRLGTIVIAWPGSTGCDRLIERGAGVVESPDDVEAALAGSPRSPAAPVYDDPIVARVALAMAGGATSVDAIAAITQIPVRAILRAMPLIPASVVRKS